MAECGYCAMHYHGIICLSVCYRGGLQVLRCPHAAVCSALSVHCQAVCAAHATPQPHALRAAWAKKLACELAHHVQGPVQVDGGCSLSVHRDDICASFGKVRDAQLRLHNHLQPYTKAHDQPTNQNMIFTC